MIKKTERMKVMKKIISLITMSVDLSVSVLYYPSI